MAPALTYTTTTMPFKAADSRARVQSFDLSTAKVDEVVDALKRDGGVFVRNFVDTSTVNGVEMDIRPYLDADTKWEGEFFPTGTRRVLGLAAKSPLFTEKIIMHPLWRDVCDALLSVENTFWNGQTKTTNTSRPQLSATAVFSVGPGSEKQELHRDDMAHHNVVPATTYEKYTVGRDSGIGLFVAGKKTTKLNGATRFVPGSHLTASGDPPPNEEVDPDCCVYAEMEPGDAFMMLSSCYHGGSTNSSNEERLVVACFSIKGVLRQVRNNFIYTRPLTTLRYFGFF
jgi:ectoine hydroxylase-related dioxygenase (phytanoyl-CoA dioxygenase family)